MEGYGNAALGYRAGMYLQGDGNVSLGLATNTVGTTPRPIAYSVAIGTEATSLTDKAVAIGHNTSASGVGTTATGADSQVDGDYGTAYGANALAKTNDTAIGYNARANADGAVVIGANSSTSSLNSVAVGADATIATGADGSMALGQNAQAQTSASGAVALGQNSIATEANTVSIGSASLQRRITNVAAGVNGTDAVNVDQLNSQLGALDVDPHLTVNASNSLGLGHTSVIGTTNNSVALGEGSVASEDNTVSVGSTTQQRRITNLADGVADSDAATVGQLNALVLSDSNLAGQVTNLSNRVDELDVRMNSVGAMAAAMSSAHAAPQTMGETQLAIGIGNYNGSNAVAASLFHYMNNRTLLSAGVSKAPNSNAAVSVGATFAW
ncbi:MAG: YadA-like family protein [Sedimenticola sp.]